MLAPHGPQANLRYEPKTIKTHRDFADFVEKFLKNEAGVKSDTAGGC
jgi:hypothetical protein